MSFRAKVVAFGTSILLLGAAVFGFSSLLGQPKLPQALTDVLGSEIQSEQTYKLPSSPERMLPPAGQARDLAEEPLVDFPLDINTARAWELEALPGIGPVLADRIAAYREEVGGFTSIEQLMEVKGIGPKKFAAIRELVFLTQ